MSAIQGKDVLITGGGRGIGALMAQEFLSRGAAGVTLWDLNQAALDETAQKLRHFGARVTTQVVDVRDLAQMKSALLDLAAARVSIDILVNNAGVVVGKKFLEHTPEDIELTLSVNSTALMQLALLVLPAMKVRSSGHIVNIASAAAMVSNPNMSVYCASKWAVAGWSDSLRLELERDKLGIHVTTVYPYYIHTGMFEGVRSSFVPILKPEYVARKIVNAVEKNQIILRLPRILYFVRLLQGLLGTRLFDLVAGVGLGIYRSMDQFKGRS